MTDLKVKTERNLAYAIFNYTIAADPKDRHIEGSGLGTAVLEKRGNDWVIIHSHSSSRAVRRLKRNQINDS